MTHSCSLVCFGTPISSNVFGPVLTGLSGAGLGVVVVGGGVAIPLPLESTEGPGLGLAAEGVAESARGGGWARLELLFDCWGRGVRWGRGVVAELLVYPLYATLGGGRASGGAVYPMSTRELTGGKGEEFVWLIGWMLGEFSAPG